MMVEKEWHYLPTSENITWPPIRGVQLYPELIQILKARGIKTPEDAKAFLNPSYYVPASPFDLPDLQRAVDILNNLIDTDNRSVLIWGDFDADGQTSTAILVEGLRQLGFEVTYYIPDRNTESHGVHMDSLKLLIDDEPPDLLLVCDTGSSHVEPIAYAKSLGLQVIVADHHELDTELPPADALINPLRLSEQDHPLRTLSGVGVSYLLLCGFYISRGFGADKPHQFLDLVAIGLVADIVSLIKDTRYLVQQGIEALRQSRRPGLLALLNGLQLEQASVTAIDIAFKIAPTLNALSRLDTASIAVQLLITHDPVEAQTLAQHAITRNMQRRLLTDQTYQAAEEQIEADTTLLNDSVLVLSSPTWKSGIIGIVAARLAEVYHMPVAIFVEDSNLMRGSIRSTPGYHVSKALTYLNSLLTEDIQLVNFGGHEGAGGLGITTSSIIDDASRPYILRTLRRRLSEAFDATAEEVPAPTLTIAATLGLDQLGYDFARQLEYLGPFGEGNPLPVFATHRLKLLSVADLGRNGKHRRLIVQDQQGHRQSVLWWNSADAPLPEGQFNIAYTIGISTYRDEPEVQVMLVDWQQVAAPIPEPTQRAELIDFRGHQDALQEVHQRETDVVVWAEGNTIGVPFSKLSPAKALVVLTTPSSRQDITKAIERVQPERIYFVMKYPSIRDPKHFVNALYKYIMETVFPQQEGTVSYTELCEHFAVTKSLVQLGLQYLAALGRLTIVEIGRNVIKLAAEGRSIDIEVAEIKRRIKREWDELQARRRHFRRKVENLENLLQ